MRSTSQIVGVVGLAQAGWHYTGVVGAGTLKLCLHLTDPHSARVCVPKATLVDCLLLRRTFCLVFQKIPQWMTHEAFACLYLKWRLAPWCHRKAYTKLWITAAKASVAF